MTHASRIEFCVKLRLYGAMSRFDGGERWRGLAVAQKGDRGGCGPYCQNPRPRYRSTHRHTLEEPRGTERGEKERQRETVEDGDTDNAESDGDRAKGARQAGCKNATKGAERKEDAEPENQKRGNSFLCVFPR